MCSWEHECEVWCDCLYPPVGLLNKKSISAFAPREPNTARLPDNRGRPRSGLDRAVTELSSRLRVLSDMSGCDGSVLKDRREAGVTCWGKGGQSN